MDPSPDEQPAGIGFKIVVLVLGLAIAGIAFSAVNRGNDSTAPPTSTADRTVTLLAQGLQLFGGDDLRIAFEPAAGATLILRFVPDTARIALCPLSSFDQPLPPAQSCRQSIFSGVRQEVAAADLRGVAFVLREGSARADLSIEYVAAGGKVKARLPLLPAPPSVTACKDNACNPFFELRPVRPGSFTARARWSGGDAALVLLQGSVLGKAFTATGFPYAEPARSDGGSPLEVAATLSAPAEYALAFQHQAGPSAAALRDVVIEASWPR